MLLPFLLPKMHERYFYVADLLSIIVAFYQPSLFFVPVLMITISFFAYQPTLFGVEPVPIGLLALGIFVMLICAEPARSAEALSLSPKTTSGNRAVQYAP